MQKKVEAFLKEPIISTLLFKRRRFYHYCPVLRFYCIFIFSTIKQKIKWSLYIKAGNILNIFCDSHLKHLLRTKIESFSIWISVSNLHPWWSHGKIRLPFESGMVQVFKLDSFWYLSIFKSENWPKWSIDYYKKVFYSFILVWKKK